MTTPYRPPALLHAGHDVSAFTCRSDEQTDWLRRHARQSSGSGTTRTRVLVVTPVGSNTVVAYYAWCMASVSLAEAPERIRQGAGRYPQPMALLARLGVDVGHEGRGIGAGLLVDVIARNHALGAEIGCRGLLVHAETEQARDVDVHLVPEFESSPTDNLHLFLLMKDIRRTLAQRRDQQVGGLPGERTRPAYDPAMMASTRHRWRAMRFHVDRVRRHVAMIVDRVLALGAHRLRPPRSVPFDGRARFALITVNFSTTTELRLMLATLVEQDGLDRLCRIVVVDNGSRDGGRTLGRRLAREVDRIDVVTNRTRLNHARGLRSGLRRLDRLAGSAHPEPNVILFCDTDVIFRRPDTLETVARCFEQDGAVLVGEVRGDLATSPDIQASFVAVRRDVLAGRHITPPIYSGSPLAWMQAMIAQAGHTVVDLRSNDEGYILHRGRSGVAAAARSRPRHHYATVRSRRPHYMGVPDGEQIWREAEGRVADRIGAGDEALVRAVSETLASSTM